MAVQENRGIFSGNMLKMIAAAAMTLDHVGLMLFPDAAWLRIVGRLAFPIFAFMIAEGCHYTKNKCRYFLQIFTLAAVCQAVYFIVDRSLYMSILVTFSLSILVIFAFQNLKNPTSRTTGANPLRLFLLGVTLIFVYWLNTVLQIDYGFWGCMVPVFAAVPRIFEGLMPRLDRKNAGILFTFIGLILLAIDLGGNQIWGLAAVPLLLLYSGKRGASGMKYFFYIFYPLHLAVIQGIAWLL